MIIISIVRLWLTKLKRLFTHKNSPAYHAVGAEMAYWRLRNFMDREQLHYMTLTKDRMLVVNVLADDLLHYDLTIMIHFHADQSKLCCIAEKLIIPNHRLVEAEHFCNQWNAEHSHLRSYVWPQRKTFITEYNVVMNGENSANFLKNQVLLGGASAEKKFFIEAGKKIMLKTKEGDETK